MIIPSESRAMVRTQTVLLCLLFAATLCSASTPFQGGRAGGMASAFVGLADDSSAIAHNPAGLAFVDGTYLYAGATGLALETTYTSPAGESQETDFRVFVPPHLFLSSDMGLQNAVVGVGVFSPFGVGGRQWSKSGMTRYISTRNDISTVVINPTMAWRITPSFSVGVGIDYLYAITEAESMVDQSFLGASDAKMYLDGDGDGWGYNVGAMLKLDRFNFGMAYRSNVKVDVSGTAKLSGIAEPLAPLFGGTTFRSDASTSMEFPDIVSFGVSYRPTERLVIDVDWEIYGWSSFDTATLDFATEVPAAGIVDSTSIYDWEDSDQIKIGMEYLVNDQLALRAGYAYLSAQVPDYTLTPISPESDQHNFAVGFGYTTGKIRFDAYYIYTPFKDRKVENQILSGKYENTANYLGMSLSYAF